MNKVNEEALYKRYAAFFRQKDLSVMESCMPWGICCGDGWLDIIDAACATIRNHIDSVERSNAFVDECEREGTDLPYGKQEVPYFEFAQIKEKFGTLRLYYDGGDEYIAGVISMAESMSESVCEDCGKPGSRRDGGWIRTLCDACEEE